MYVKLEGLKDIIYYYEKIYKIYKNRGRMEEYILKLLKLIKRYNRYGQMYNHRMYNLWNSCHENVKLTMIRRKKTCTHLAV